MSFARITALSFAILFAWAALYCFFMQLGRVDDFDREFFVMRESARKMVPLAALSFALGRWALANYISPEKQLALKNYRQLAAETGLVTLGVWFLAWMRMQGEYGRLIDPSPYQDSIARFTGL